MAVQISAWKRNIPVKRPGRPRIDEDDTSIPLTVSLPSKQLRAAEQKAVEDRMKVHDWIRRVIREAADGNKSV